MKDLYSIKAGKDILEQNDFLLENSAYELFRIGIGFLLFIHIVLESMNVFSELDRTTDILIVIVGIIGILINYILEIRKINNDEKQKN